MEELFVTYEVAKILKEKGFNELCIAGYENKKAKLFSEINHTLDGNIHRNSEGSFTTAPMCKYVIKWFKIKHSIIIDKKNNSVTGFCYSEKFETLEQAFKKALTLIIY